MTTKQIKQLEKVQLEPSNIYLDMGLGENFSNVYVRSFPATKGMGFEYFFASETFRVPTKQVNYLNVYILTGEASRALEVPRHLLHRAFDAHGDPLFQWVSQDAKREHYIMVEPKYNKNIEVGDILIPKHPANPMSMITSIVTQDDILANPQQHGLYVEKQIAHIRNQPSSTLFVRTRCSRYTWVYEELMAEKGYYLVKNNSIIK